MAAIEEVSNVPDAEEEWKVRTSNLETMTEFRSRKLEEMLNRLSKPDTFTIQPAMGQVVFFEIEFSNPWDQRKKFQIQINDPMMTMMDSPNSQDTELKLVTNVKEMSYLKEKCNSSTEIKRNLFHRDDANEIIVGPNETVYIPFKFQSFASGSGESDNSESQCIEQRKINVAIFDVDDQQNSERMELAAFVVSVEPIRFSIDRTFNIYAVQKTKFSGTLPLPSLQNIRANHDEHVLSVRCSSNEAAFECDPENVNITLRCDVGPSPKQKQFYIIIYNDRYSIDINEIWEINVHSYHHQDCHGALGGVIKSNIHLPSFMDNIGSEALQFYGDQPNGVEFVLSDIDNKRVLNVEYAPPDIGKKVLRIHGVDKMKGNVLWSCLLLIHVEMPKINNSFVIHIESGENEDVLTRKLPYSNRYNQDRHYEVVSKDPSVIRVNNPILEIPADSTMEFVLDVFPKNIPGHSKEVLLFVTERGNLEECLRIEVKKGKVISL